MKIFDEETADKLRDVLKKMKNNVKVLFFTQEYECSICKDTREFLNEFSELSDKIKVEIYDFKLDEDVVKKYGVDKIPAIVINNSDNQDIGIKYYGVPGGYEINSFLMSLLEVSGADTGIPQEIIGRIEKIDKNIHIQVFVSLGCPHCPESVISAHTLALFNPKIKAEMIDTTIFPHLANKYNVVGVPKIVINETGELIGASSLQRLIDEIDKL